MRDVIVIGGGHNGLAAAFYLARAGLTPIVLERRPQVGGGAVTEEIHPGFRAPTLSHEVLLHETIARDMELARHGVEGIAGDATLCALQPDGPALVLDDDMEATAARIRALSPGDAEAYPAFRRALSRVGSVLGAALAWPPLDVAAPDRRDLWNLFRLGRRFRSLGRRDGYRLLRWAPMAVADLLSEWFTSDLLCAALAGAGVSGTWFGPRSGGSALVLLMREAHRLQAGVVLPRGGPGALTRALAAAAVEAGARVRVDTPVDRILVRNGRATGVAAGGIEMPAAAVVSAIDPKSTFLRLMDPADLMPGFALRIRNYRAAGTLAKVNLALSDLPHFAGVEHIGHLSGRVHVGPDLDYLERAFDHVKYGEYSSAPWLDITFPSIADDSLAPAGAHVASIYVHCAPRHLRAGTWNAARADLLETALDTLEPYAPDLRSKIVAAQVVTPEDLESSYGYFGGHVFHGELALDQLFTMRPVPDHGRYAGPIDGLFLCGAGTHPGGFLTGTSGRLAAQAVAAALAR